MLGSVKPVLDELEVTYEEAAYAIGASAWQTFRHVTLPMVFPTTFFVTVTALIGAFQLFGEAFVMTQGGPGYATTTLVYYVYQNGFSAFRMGYAALIAWVLFFVIFAVTLVQWRVARERDGRHVLVGHVADLVVGRVGQGHAVLVDHPVVVLQIRHVRRVASGISFAINGQWKGRPKGSVA